MLSRLSRLRQRRESVALWSGIFNGLAAALLIALAAIIAELLGHFSIAGRTWLFGTGLPGAIAAILGFSLDPILTRVGLRPHATDDELAQTIGRYYPTVRDRLVNTLQLARPLFSKSANLLGSPSLALAAFSHTYESVRPLDFNAIVDDRPVKRAALLFCVTIVLGFAAFLGAGHDMLAASTRLTHFRTFYQKPAPFTFVVSPGNARVMRGDSVRIIVITRGEQLKSIELRTREEGQKDFDPITLQAMPLDSARIKASSIQGVAAKSGFVYSLHAQHPVEYYAASGEIESDRFKVSVLDHPIVRSLNVEVQPPAYTRQKPITLAENIGDISGVTGTRGVFRVVASAPLVRAEVLFTSVDSVKDGTNTSHEIHESHILSILDSIATGVLSFTRSGSYHIELLDRDSVASEHPIEYAVTITADAPPQIALIEPSVGAGEGRVDLPSDMRLDMMARIHDDYGFSGMRLGYRLSKSKYVAPETTYKWLTVPLSNYAAQDLDVPYIWNLTPLGIGPEDEVSYVMEVADNDAISGPKRARTPEYTVRVPSVEEIFKRADEEANKAQKDMAEVKRDAEDLQRKVNETLDEMKQMKTTDLARSMQDFSKQKDVQQMLERQKNLNDRIDQVAKDLQQMTKSMEQQQVLTPETMQKYQELQELFKQIDSPELKKAMEDLQKAMAQNADPKKLAEAMQNMKTNEEQFRKSIERTANILKKIQAEQKVDALMKSASELAKQEQKAADSTRSKLDQGKKMTPEEKAAEARKQADAQKELDRMREEMKQIAEQMKKLPENMQAPEETKAAAQALADPSTDHEMEQAQQDAQQGNMPQSAQHSENASKQMKQAQRKLADLKRKMSENERQRTMREMKQIRDELNRLSQKEEQIKNQAHQAQPNSNVFRDMAEQQSQTKDQLGQTASKAMQLAQKSTSVTPEMGKEMGKAFADMQHAEDAMTERNQSGSEQNSQSAMSSLNKASQAMQKAMQQMMAQKGQSGQGGSGGEGEDGQEGEGQSGESGQMPGQNGQGGSALQQFISQINKLAQQQQALNNQMQAMAQGAGGSQSAQKELMRQQAAMSRLQAQQQAVKKSLEQMADEQRQSRTGVSQAAEDLRKIADEMQESIGDMRSNGIRPETIQRQERILSRLLQAQHSVHERDKDQERESKPGQNVVRESPRQLEINSPEGQKALQEEMLRTRENGFTPDYNALIRKYFEELEKK
ncbi:MAG: hypothetical protein Q8922_07120 [Bacteroidota bacterium]|nr:hypothetical protein [Bacteroidota bacterium]MDP4234004.1 hypothetical protein [Bacteroidota bacterium]MDP4242871.1 hypothetical protein [Bacteroidota bacterium]MDP4287691.1 hypothetical protein [Bacteroidota bacterium]